MNINIRLNALRELSLTLIDEINELERQVKQLNVLENDGMTIEEERKLFEIANPLATSYTFIGANPDKHNNFNVYLHTETQIKFAGFCQGLRTTLKKEIT